MLGPTASTAPSQVMPAATRHTWHVIPTLVVTAILAAAPYVAMYAARPSVSPVGSDSPTYVWRTRLVSAFGVSALSDASPFPFHGNTANADRPGFPVLGSLLRAAGVSPWRFVFVLPAAAAAVAALAAGAFGVLALREPDWTFPVYGLAVAWSPQLAVTANGYLDNMLVDGLLLAAAAAALAAAARAAGREGGADAPRIGVAILLFVGATSIHWIFAAFVLAVVGGAAVVALPGSLRRPAGTPMRRTPAGSLGGIVVGSALGGAGAILLAPGLPAAFTPKTRVGYLANLTRQLPYYDAAGQLPVAAAGAAALGLGDGEDRRERLRGLGLAAMWLLPIAAGWLAWEAGRSFPVQRLLGFSLPVPLLAAAGFAWLLRVGWRRLRWVGAAVGVVLTIAALAASAVLAWRALDRTTPVVDAGTLERTQSVMRYLEGIPAERPVVFVVDGQSATSDFRAIPAFRRIRASAPAPLIARISVYVGDPRILLRDRPTARPGAPAFGRVSQLYWSHLRPVLARDPLVVAMTPYYSHVDALTRDGVGSPLIPGIVVIGGPAPATAIRMIPPTAVRGRILVRDTAATLLVLLLAGSGWSALGGRRGLGRWALAPALGAATLVTAGLAWSRAGGSLAAAPGGGVVVVVALLGWVPSTARRLAGHRPLRRRQAGA